MSREIMENKIDTMLIEEVTQKLRSKTVYFDQSGEFPHSNFDHISSKGLHLLPLNSKFGGLGYGFEEIGKIILQLASGCPSTALCLAMHYYTIAGMKEVKSFKYKEKMFDDIHKNGEFVASFNQPNISTVQYNPSVDGSTNITVENKNGGYLVNGTKFYVSGIPRFKYLPVFGEDLIKSRKKALGITALLLTKDDKGISIGENWNLSGMKATHSNHITFNNVFVSEERLIGREGYGIEDTQGLIFWSRLAISSVYLGIAKAAIDHILLFVKQKKDMISRKPLAFMPGIQFGIADIKVKFDTAYNQLIMFARQADYESSENDNYSKKLLQQSLVTKYYITNISNEIVLQAMKMEGMQSMFQGSFLEMLYRDVCAANFHIPTGDFLKEMLAKSTLGVMIRKERWC